jgi:chaperonin GroEL (HSP60 family)
VFIILITTVKDVFILQELEDPLILIHDKKISNMHAVVKVLEMALQVLVSIKPWPILAS